MKIIRFWGGKFELIEETGITDTRQRAFGIIEYIVAFFRK
jgi:hypothetical protein